MKILRGVVVIFLTSQLLSCAMLSKKNPHEFQFKKHVTVTHEVLPNGLTVILAKNPKAPLASVYHWVKVGSLHEQPGVTGMAHLFEHMMFRPVGEGKKNFHKLVAELGASVNANTRFGSTVYLSHVPHENLKKLLSYEADRFKNLKVSEELLTKEKEAVRSEYITKMDANPVIDLWDRVYKAGFKGHPYGWMIVGFRKDLNGITSADCNRFFQKFYKPNNVGIVVSGDFDPKEVMKWIKSFYGNWQPGERTVLPAPFKGDGKMVRGFGKLDSKSRFVLSTYRTPDPNVFDHRIMDLANYIFFESSYSLAHRTFELENKWTSSTSDFNYFYDRGNMKLFVNLNADIRMEKFLEKLFELNSLFSKMTANEFDAYKKSFQLAQAEGVLRNSSLAKTIAFGWGKYGDYTSMLSASRDPYAVTKKQIQNFVDEYFVKSNLIVVTNKNFKD